LINFDDPTNDANRYAMPPTKGKGDSLDIAPPSEGTSLQKHSGMARVVEQFHAFIHEWN